MVASLNFPGQIKTSCMFVFQASPSPNLFFLVERMPCLDIQHWTISCDYTKHRWCRNGVLFNYIKKIVPQLIKTAAVHGLTQWLTC